ncbi:MAG: hypothetical protein AAB367_04470 [Patescibacteria group bacterium]
MESPRKPFTLYTYYLLAFVVTFVAMGFLTAAFPDMNENLWIMLWPTFFIGTLLVGYAKWYRYRKLTGLTGKDTQSYGLGSMPAGIAIGTAKDLVGAKRPQEKGELPRYIIFIFFVLVFVGFSLIIKYFSS